MLRDTWYVTHDTQGVVRIVSKFQVPCFIVRDIHNYEDISTNQHLIDQLFTELVAEMLVEQPLECL